MKYQYLDSEDCREDVLKIGNTLAKHLHSEEITNIIFADRSARPGYIALKKAWKNNFPNEQSPNVYFTNPEKYSHAGVEEVVEEFSQTYKSLCLDKDAKIMLFDVCLHTGRTMEPILRVMYKVGFSNISVGFTQPEDKRFSTRVPVSFAALNYTPENHCYPFSIDNIVKKNTSSILSTRNSFKGNSPRSIELRKEISNIFQQHQKGGEKNKYLHTIQHHFESFRKLFQN